MEDEKAAPIPVTIASPVPIPVAVIEGSRTRTGEFTQRQSIDPSLPASTTFQEDLTSAGQRNINAMWEGTQRQIALAVVGVSLIVLGYLVVAPGVPTELRLVALSTLSNVLFAVTSVYFTRTNHTKTGGVKPGDMGR